jgi:hypothetical protein
MSDTVKDAIAFDDFGLPITEGDLVAESYRPLLPDEPISLLPPDDFMGDDEDWETRCLIESVKKRRRSQQGKENGNV